MKTLLHRTVLDLKIGTSYTGPKINDANAFTQKIEIGKVICSNELETNFYHIPLCGANRND